MRFTETTIPQLERTLEKYDLDEIVISTEEMTLMANSTKSFHRRKPTNVLPLTKRQIITIIEKLEQSQQESPTGTSLFTFLNNAPDYSTSTLEYAAGVLLAHVCSEDLFSCKSPYRFILW